MGTKRVLKARAKSKTKKSAKKRVVKKFKAFTQRKIVQKKKIQQLNPFYWLWGGVATALLTIVFLSNTKHQHGTHVTERTVASTEQNRIQMTPVEAQFYQVKNLRFQERVGVWSGFLQDSPFARDFLSELGAGPKIKDHAPLIDKRFDCTTFTETVIALSKSNNAEEFFKNLIAIRYKNTGTTYFERNHFPEADWIPNNLEYGYLKDITQEVAQRSNVIAKTAMKRIDRGRWLTQLIESGKENRTLASLAQSDWSTPVDVELGYVGLEDVDVVLRQIPHGAVVNIVREPRGSKPVLITHQGFVLQENGQTLIRHSSATGKIRTRPLRDYLRAMYKESTSWPVIGLNFNQFN